MVPSASGAASARLTSRCCSTSDSPSNDPLSTVTWKWSPPPVRSSTSTPPSGNASSRSARIASIAIGDDANDGGLAAPSSLPSPSGSCARSPRLLGGTLHETFELTLPRIVRSSRLYEATAKNLLRVTIELVGGVEARVQVEDEFEPDPGRLAVRKGAGNVVELGSIAAFGFSPLWILAAAADVTRGSRVYLDAFVSELVRAGALPEGSAPGLGRRPARRARGRLRHERASRRHPAARGARPPAVARRHPPRRSVAPEPRRARRRLRRAARGVADARGRACSRCPSGSGSRSSTRPGTSAASTCSTPIARTWRPCATRASARTRAASRVRTRRR